MFPRKNLGITDLEGDIEGGREIAGALCSLIERDFKYFYAAGLAWTCSWMTRHGNFLPSASRYLKMESIVSKVICSDFNKVHTLDETVQRQSG